MSWGKHWHPPLKVNKLSACRVVLWRLFNGDIAQSRAVVLTSLLHSRIECSNSYQTIGPAQRHASSINWLQALDYSVLLWYNSWLPRTEFGNIKLDQVCSYSLITRKLDPSYKFSAGQTALSESNELRISTQRLQHNMEAIQQQYKYGYQYFQYTWTCTMSLMLNSRSRAVFLSTPSPFSFSGPHCRDRGTPKEALIKVHQIYDLVFFLCSATTCQIHTETYVSLPCCYLAAFTFFF